MTTASTTPPVILVDGSSYLFRAYHALPPLTNSQGLPTGAIKGVIGMLRSLKQRYPGSTVIVVFDTKGKNFRHAIYAEYKANRPPMPEDLACQIEPIHAIIRALGLPLLAIPEVEADDVIGTLAEQATRHGIDTVISTGDKDMAQLVSEHVTLENTMTDTRMNADGVKEKFGVPPERIVDYLALMGDTVDNIPGVPKCGPKTAAKWLQEFGSLDALMQRADEVSGKIGESLRASLEWLPTARQLTTINTAVALPMSLSDIRPGAEDREALRTLFQTLEFKGWLNALDKEPGDKAVSASNDVMAPGASNHTPAVAPTAINTEGYDTVLTLAAFEQWLQRLAAAPHFAFDTETTSLNYMDARIVGVSFCIAPGEAAYVPLAHDYMGAPEQLDRNEVLSRLKPLLEDPSKGKIGQNLKYDSHVLANHGITLQGIHDDTMLLSYVLDAAGSRHDMDSLSRQWLQHPTIKFEDIAGKGVKQLRFNEIEVERAAPYAAEDADVTLRLQQAMAPGVLNNPNLLRVYRDIELPLVPILVGMERRGVLLDVAMLQAQSKEIADQLVRIERQAFEAAGCEFNLGSPKQLQEILYGKMGIPVTSKTPTGQPSTAEAVLQELAESHALPKIILEHRGLSKLKSTYTDRLPEQINPATGRVHTSYHQAVAATGRLSSSDPNLQNIPIRSAEGRRIRQAFIAPPGFTVVAADYSQIELRIMAHLSGDAGLLDAFAHGEDIHRATAAEVFGVTRLEVSTEQRRSAKAINFGLIYGMSAFGLAAQLGVDRGTAQAYIDTYFERYPGVLRYMDDTRRQAHTQGYVETLFGRRLSLADINARNRNLQQAAERTAINAPMQGTAADIIKRAMLTVAARLADHHDEIRMIMQVHDELVFEVRCDRLDHWTRLIRTDMASAAELRVPLVVDIGTGRNWDEAH